MSRKATSSLFVAIATGASIGLLLPALLIGGLLIGLREPQVAAREVVAAITMSPDVVRVLVNDSTQSKPFIDMHFPEREQGRLHLGQRDIMRGSARIGQLKVELDDHLLTAALTRQRWLYGATLGGQLLVSLALILMLMDSRPMRPMRELGGFANDLAGGRFGAQLKRGRDDEIGLLGEHLEHMRDALKQQFQAQHDLISRLRGMAETVPGVVYQQRMRGLVRTHSRAGPRPGARLPARIGPQPQRLGSKSSAPCTATAASAGCSATRSRSWSRAAPCSGTAF